MREVKVKTKWWGKWQWKQSDEESESENKVMQKMKLKTKWWGRLRWKQSYEESKSEKSDGKSENENKVMMKVKTKWRGKWKWKQSDDESESDRQCGFFHPALAWPPSQHCPWSPAYLCHHWYYGRDKKCILVGQSKKLTQNMPNFETEITSRWPKGFFTPSFLSYHHSYDMLDISH